MTGRKSGLQNDWFIFLKGIYEEAILVCEAIIFKFNFRLDGRYFQELQLNNNLVDFSQFSQMLENFIINPVLGIESF